MPITALDIKFRQSQRLTDNADGGGRMVQAEIVDGKMNNLFPDIGDEERTTGRSTLRKAFVHVDTPTTDVLKDAIAVIIDPPSDPSVHVSMFATGSYSDVRSDARNRVESYITRGVESRYTLLGNHFSGQMAVQFYCMKDAPSPDVNDNLSLFTNASGYTQREQYLRVKSVLSRGARTFYDDSGAFERDVIVVETVTALLYDFFGQEVVRYTSTKPPTRVYETNVVDATSYYSVKRLTDAAQPGDLSVLTDSPYVTIVPTSTAEVPMVDVLAGLGTISYVQAGADGALQLGYSSSFAAGVGVTRHLATPMLVGSVKVVAGGTELTDDGMGSLASAGTTPWAGTVDYQAGSITLVNATGAGNTAVSISATPAGAIADQGYNERILITQNNQGYNWVFQLSPLPSAGTVVVDYRALGRWIRLTDNGRGQLIGKAGQGSGTVNYATGSVVVTTGALPDLDSAIIPSWGTGVIAERRSSDVAITPPALHFLLGHTGVRPGSAQFTLVVGGANVAVTDNGLGELLIAGAVRGSITYSTGEVMIWPVDLPDGNSVLACRYEWGAVVASALQPVPDGAGVGSFAVAGAPLRAGTLRFDWLVTIDRDANDNGMAMAPRPMRALARDDGNGNLLLVSVGGQEMTTVIGSVNYVTGAVSIQLGQFAISNFSVPLYGTRPSGTLKVTGYHRIDVTAHFSAGTMVSIEAIAAGAGMQEVDESLALPPVQLLLTPTISDSIVPGSVRFTYRGRTYVDRVGGLYYGIDPVSGSGTYAGSIDYATGAANISQWAAGGSNQIQVVSLLTRIADPGTAGVFFRTPGSPLRPGNFTVRANALDGQLLTGSADINGRIATAAMRGKVDWDTGLAEIEFGSLVPVSGNEGAPWFDPSNVEGDQVWRPDLAIAGSVYIGAVVYRSIPLSAVVIGLESVRLPSDGRVPAFKPGQTVLIHHTARHTVAAPAAGQVINFGRGRIAQIEVRDSAGTAVDSVWYGADLDVGTLTFNDPLNLSAYVLPIVISERVEDRRLVVQPQITGEIELNTGLTHEFPAGESMISTALRLGEANGSLDLQARVENLFDQAAWTNVWSNEPIGSVAPGTYNETDYPLAVTNADAITERWAIRFTSATQFEVIGETVGTIAAGNTTTDLGPINPRTEQPYFMLRRQGWGIGWATNNVVRFNTVGGLAPVWMVRTTLPGAPQGVTDSSRLQVIGNIAGAAE